MQTDSPKDFHTFTESMNKPKIPGYDSAKH